MDKNKPNRAAIYRKKYLRAQQDRGFVRFELQVSAKSKARFDALVDAVADEQAHPWDSRRRIAKARAQIFEEITHGVVHEFFTLKDQIQALKAEIKVLSPQFFHTKDNPKIPLPESIRALPDDSKYLKALLAKTHQEAQLAKKRLVRLEETSTQNEKLYYTVQEENEELKRQLRYYQKQK